MKKVLVFSINSIFILLTWFTTGCSAQPKKKEFTPKPLDEYYNILENSTIEMELFVDDKRTTCFYSNDTQLFVFTIKYQQSNEYGYLYDKSNNELYNIENHSIETESINKNPINIMNDLFEESYFLFHLKFDPEKFEYKESTYLCNKLCDVYRFVDEVKGEEAVFNIYIDQETGLCLKGVCSINDLTYVYFETKKFVNQPCINDYYKKIEEYNNKK